MSQTLHAKYRLIRSRENMFARSVAVSVIRPEPFSVWDVMLPIIFILNYMKHKQSRELFAQNILFTKNLALQSSMQMKKKNLSRGNVIKEVEMKTMELLISDTQGFYSDMIRDRQIEEISIMIDHFSLLLDNEGKDYHSLVKNSYKNRDNYSKYTEKLTRAEREVMTAARNTLGERANAAMAEKMETAIEKARLIESDQIFKM